MKGWLDFDVMRNTPLPGDLQHRLLLREPLCAVVHWVHPLADADSISIQALASKPFMFFDPQGGPALYGEILALLHRYQIKPFITQGSGEAMTILGLQESDTTSEVWLVWSVPPVSRVRK